MERVKTIAWWVVAALFLLWTLAAFPSLGCLLFLIGAAVSAPLPAVRDFWDEKGLRGAPKVALAVALLIAGSVAAQDRFAERGAEQESPSETAETAEAAPPAVPDGGETAPEAVEESAPPEIETPENAIMLVAGEKGEYGKWTAMNDETFYAYYLPGGVYSVTNAGEYPTQVSVYEGIQRNFETGFDEYSATGGALRLEVGESGEITIPDGWFAEIHEPTKAAFVRIGDAPEPESEPVAETPEPVGYDALQELYVTFPLGVSFQEAIAFLDAAGLPYSSEKYNGGRVCQVSTEKDGTAQKYNRSGLPYVTISYKYPSGENSANDVLEKYQFTRIEYYPAQGYFSFRTESETYGEIRRLGTNIGQNLTREEQIAFFYKYKDDKTAFR